MNMISRLWEIKLRLIFSSTEKMWSIKFVFVEARLNDLNIWANDKSTNERFAEGVHTVSTSR